MIYKLSLFALVAAACQQPFSVPIGRNLCQDGYHWVADSAGYHNICVKDGAGAPKTP